MRAGIDLTLLRPGRLTGIERYAIELVRAMAARVPTEIVLFTGPVVDETIVRLDVEQHRAPWSARLPVDQVWLPWAAARARVDLLHMLAFPSPALWSGRSILTIHDATPWLFRETTSMGMRLYYRPLFPRAIGRADAIVTHSEASKRDIAAACGASPDRIRVAPLGCHSPLFPGDARAAGSAPCVSSAPFVLFVGTLEPRKNLHVLIDAFRMLRRDGRTLELVLAGRQGWGPHLDLGDVRPHVRLEGHVTDLRLATLYRSAACFVLPSLHEGFGLTLLEAMAAGVPAVAADIPALRELGADTVCYAEPQSASALASAIAACLDDQQAASVRAQRARLRARDYSWERCAQITIDTYRDVLSL